MNKNVLFQFAFFVGSMAFFSCGTQNLSNRVLYADSIKMDLYEVADTAKVDFIIQKARLEHKRITGCYASSFEFIQDRNTQKCYVYSSTFYTGLSDAYGISRTLGFSFYDNNIILVHKDFSRNLFVPKGEEAYVMLMSSDGKDFTECVFDSTYHFLESQNAIVEIR